MKNQLGTFRSTPGDAETISVAFVAIVQDFKYYEQGRGAGEPVWQRLSRTNDGPMAGLS